MPVDIDHQLVMAIIELEEAASAATRRDFAANGGSTSHVFSVDNPQPRRSPEEVALRERLAELDDRQQAELLALYWLGRRSGWEPVNEETYNALLVQAESNLEDAPLYLAGKVNLSEALRAALVVLAP